MMTLQAANAQPPNEAIEIDNDYSSVYQTMYAASGPEQEASEAYNAEELSLEVV